MLRQGGMPVAVVWEATIRGVTVRIHDDYCRDLSEEAVNKALERIAAQAMADWNAEAEPADNPS